jgi:hypothetical protein
MNFDACGRVWEKATMHPTQNDTELRLVGTAHPTTAKAFRPFARVDWRRVH